MGVDELGYANQDRTSVSTESAFQRPRPPSTIYYP
jgi:hypothetical protein